MSPIELQVGMDRWQEFLQPHHVVRVWRVGSMELVPELSIPLLTTLICQHLYQAALMTEIQAVTRRPLATAPPRAQTPPVGPPSAPERALLRAARRTRRPT